MSARLVRFGKHVLADEAATWNDGMGNCLDHIHACVAVERTHVILPISERCVQIHTADEELTNVDDVFDDEGELDAVVAFSMTGLSVLADGPLQSWENGGFMSGPDMESVRIWHWKEGRIESVTWHPEGLAPRSHSIDTDELAAATVDAEGAVWLVVSTRRLDTFDLWVARLAGSTDVQHAHAIRRDDTNGRFAPRGWDFVLVETIGPGEVVVTTGLAGDDEDCHVVLRWSNGAIEERVRCVPRDGLRPARGLGCGANGGLLVHARGTPDVIVEVNEGAPPREVLTLPDLSGMRVYRLGDVLLAASWSEGSAFSADLRQTHLGWSKVTGLRAVQTASRKLRGEDLDPPVVAPWIDPRVVHTSKGDALCFVGATTKGVVGAIFGLEPSRLERGDAAPEGPCLGT